VTPQALRGHRRVLIDSSVWIYHFEQHAEFGVAAGRAVEALEEGAFRGVASELTLLELTVRPLQLGRQDVADEYELLLSYFPNLELEPVTREIFLDAAALRARHRLRTPDAILLATGIRTGATAAITNDDGWRVCEPSGIKSILLSDLS
jgi:predicted nucleic acid-binding protein